MTEKDPNSPLDFNKDGINSKSKISRGEGDELPHEAKSKKTVQMIRKCYAFVVNLLFGGKKEIGEDGIPKTMRLAGESPFAKKFRMWYWRWKFIPDLLIILLLLWGAVQYADSREAYKSCVAIQLVKCQGTGEINWSANDLTSLLNGTNQSLISNQSTLHGT